MNIKRPLSILAILLACTMIFTACSGKNADKADDESDDDAPVVGDYQDEEDVPVVEDDGFTIWNIKLAHGGNEETAQQMGALAMKEYIEETSEGRITVEIYSDGSMGDDRELCDNVQQGALEMCLTNSAQVEFVPDAAVYDLYFQYRNTPAVIDKFRNDDAFINTMSRTYWQAGYKLGGFSVHGFRQTTANKEIREPGDLTELTLGVQDNEYRMEGWKAMGATPVPYGSGELYNVLQQGTVDAQETQSKRSMPRSCMSSSGMSS